MTRRGAVRFAAPPSSRTSPAFHCPRCGPKPGFGQHVAPCSVLLRRRTRTTKSNTSSVASVPRPGNRSLAALARPAWQRGGFFVPTQDRHRYRSWTPSVDGTTRSCQQRLVRLSKEIQWDTTPSTSSSVISSDDVEGTSVYNSNGDKLGSIDDLMIDKSTGQVRYAVMEFGGFSRHGYRPLSGAVADAEVRHPARRLCPSR